MSCPHCQGTRWRQVTDDGVIRVVRCECWRADMARTLLDAARIPRGYEHCDLDRFVSYENEKLLKALRRARRFTETFPGVEKGLLLIGDPGIGKTHIAVAVLKQVVSEKRAHGLYYDTRSLLNAIRSTYDPVTRTSAADVLRPVLEAELLVLDDLGAERLTDWVDETMNFIVNTRYNDRRITIFTSNYADIEDADAVDSLKARVGFRIHSRLREMCEFLEYDGPDYREFEFTPTSKDLSFRWKQKKAKPRPKLPGKRSSPGRARLNRGSADLAWPGGRADG